MLGVIGGQEVVHVARMKLGVWSSLTVGMLGPA